MSGMNSDEFIKFALEAGEQIEKTGEMLGEKALHHAGEHIAEEGLNILDLDHDGSISDTVPDLLSGAFEFISGIFGG